MTVDELLKTYLSTPLFTCNIYKPQPGILKQHETAKGLFIGEKYDLHVLMKDNSSMPICNATHYADNIHTLHHFLLLAEAGFRGINIRKGYDKAGIRIPCEAVVQFCIIYGLPVFETYIEGNNIYYGFFIDDFIRKLDDLYICYALWKALFINDKTLAEKICPFIQTDEQKRSELEKRLMAENTICIKFWDSNTPQLSYHTADLIGLVKAQMAVLVSKGKNYIQNGWYIDYCKDCGQPFIRKRTNATRCPTCSGSTGKSRRYRAKQKGDQNNG